MSISTLARVFSPHDKVVYSANDFRQTLRIALAGTLALSISSFYNVQYGVFFVVYPLMLVSLVPVFNAHVARQFIFSSVINCIEMVLIIGFLSHWPVIMTLVVFALYVVRFRFMSQGPLFLFGSMGVVCQSTMLNFMSYPTNDWHVLFFSNIEACVLAVCLSALLHYLIPDVEPRMRPPVIEKDAARIRHESLLSGTVATLIFIVFQVCNLSDSLSALMAGVLSLFPMSYRAQLDVANSGGGVRLPLYSADPAGALRSQQPYAADDAADLPWAGGWRTAAYDGEGGGRGGLCQHLHPWDYVRPEYAPKSGSGVQRSLPHYLGYLVAAHHPDDGVPGPSAAQSL